MTSITLLPNEILSKIFGYLDINSFYSAKRSNRRFQKAIEQYRQKPIAYLFDMEFYSDANKKMFCTLYNDKLHYSLGLELASSISNSVENCDENNTNFLSQIVRKDTGTMEEHKFSYYLGDIRYEDSNFFVVQSFSLSIETFLEHFLCDTHCSIQNLRFTEMQPTLINAIISSINKLNIKINQVEYHNCYSQIKVDVSALSGLSAKTVSLCSLVGFENLDAAKTLSDTVNTLLFWDPFLDSIEALKFISNLPQRIHHFLTSGINYFQDEGIVATIKEWMERIPQDGSYDVSKTFCNGAHNLNVDSLSTLFKRNFENNKPIESIEVWYILFPGIPCYQPDHIYSLYLNEYGCLKFGSGPKSEWIQPQPLF